MTETWQGEWERQAELSAHEVQLPCAGVIREMLCPGQGVGQEGVHLQSCDTL